MSPKLILRPTALAGRSRFALTVMACAIGLAGTARAADCQGGATPSDAAGTAALYDRLAKNISVEPLALAIANRPLNGVCAWVYQVKVLTASGSVAVLDFDLVSLNLMRVDGPANDPEIVRLSGHLDVVTIDRNRTLPDDDPHSPVSDKGEDSDGSDSGGESGNSGSGNSGSGGSGSGGSGSGGSGSSGSGSSGSGSSGSGSGGEGGEGGDGGDGGEGGGDSD
ncbi:MAG: hypothetical protein JNL25_12950 [Rhodospirillaceae bacterium]|nr:hypothetical protein [Rhodospirillaceae bacterium]